MATLTRIIGMLQEQRRELLDQLGAIDRAIAELHGAGAAAADPRRVEPEVPCEEVPADMTPGAVVPRRVKPRRVLSDSHKQTLVLSTRKAREARDAAKGLAREMPGDSFVPAIGTRGDRQPPRLVKRPTKH